MKVLIRYGCFWKENESNELFMYNNLNSFESLESGEIFDNFERISEDLVVIIEST